MTNVVSTSGAFKSEAERQVFLSAVPVAQPVVETLADVQRAQVALLSVKCQEAIYAGFVSSALGAPHTYPAKAQDQTNLAGSVLRSTLPGAQVPGWTTPFWCMDVDGMWAYVQHTSEQIQRVGDDGAVAIVANLTRNEALARQVMESTTIEQVKAIVW